jgi:UDP-N-acetylmuramoylalanine--D-glutamate ligase
VRDGLLVGRLEGAEVGLGRAPADPLELRSALAASAAALVAGARPDAIAAGVASFPGLRFRRELVAEAGGVRVVNDAMATTPFKARAGLETIDSPIVWIAGGRATFRKRTPFPADGAEADLRSLAGAARGRVRVAVVFGEAAPTLCERLEEAGLAVVPSPDLESAVATAVSTAEEGDVILFAPANYVPPPDRGRFDDLVRQSLARDRPTPIAG